MSEKRDSAMKPFKQRSLGTNYPVFARYREMLLRLEALEKAAQEVRHRVRARRELTSGR